MKKIIVAVMLVFVSVVLGGSFVGCGKKKAGGIAGLAGDYDFKSVSLKFKGYDEFDLLDLDLLSGAREQFEGGKITFNKDGTGRFFGQDQVDFFQWKKGEDEKSIIFMDENFYSFDDGATKTVATLKNKVLTITSEGYLGIEDDYGRKVILVVVMTFEKK